MIVVSGCPRSGTSLMMDSLRIAFGNDRIMGSEYPQKRKMVGTQGPYESDNAYEARQHLMKINDSGQAEKAASDYKLMQEMNPNGFWECRYSVRGIQWHIGFKNDPKTIVKVVSQGLPQTSPEYVDKMIFMLREPHQVAKSQEHLRRMQFMDIQEERDLKIHTPEMFIKVTFQAAQWLKAHPEVPVLFVNFDDVTAEPDKEFKRIAEFLGEGDFSGHRIRVRSRERIIEQKPHLLWEVAETMYGFMCNKEYDALIEYYIAHRKEIKRDEIRTNCLRLREVVSIGQCQSCLLSKTCRTNFRIRADQRGVKWQEQPCMYECMTTPDNEHISMADSIKNNSWGDTL